MDEKESKPPTWGVENQEESEEFNELQSLRMEALDSATLAVPHFLKLIYEELKRYNDFMMTGVVDEDALKMTRSNQAPVEEPEPKKDKPAFTMPSNLKSEKDIEKFYKAELSKVLNDDQLSKVNVIVEEERVILTVGYLPTSDWRKLISLIEEMGGEYVSDGGKTHYVLPYPSS